MTYQKTIIVGNLGGDPELRYMPNGTAVCNFSVAVNKSWTDAGGEKHKKTTWFRVTAWGRQAETSSQYLSKGSAVLVEGEIEASAYTNKSGEARASLELTARLSYHMTGVYLMRPA